MKIVFGILSLLLFLFMIVLLARLAFDWIQAFARQWRPSGVMLVIAEVVYSITDPPLNALRRVLPPLRLGGMSIDLAFMALFFLVVIAMQITGALQNA